MARKHSIRFLSKKEIKAVCKTGSPVGGYSVEEIISGGQVIGEHVRLDPDPGESQQAFRRRRLDFHLYGVEHWLKEMDGKTVSPAWATKLGYLANRIGRDIWGAEQFREGREFLEHHVRPMLEGLRERILRELQPAEKQQDGKTLNRTERKILAMCRRQALKGEVIARRLEFTPDYVRHVLSNLVKASLLTNNESGYRAVR